MDYHREMMTNQASQFGRLRRESETVIKEDEDNENGKWEEVIK